MSREVIVVRDGEELSQQACAFIEEVAREAIVSRGRFALTLSGGSSPRATYERLAGARGIDWSKVYFFFGDERFVETSNPYSNYRMVEEALFSRLRSLPPQNVLKVPVDARSPAEGARRYADSIRDFFGTAPGVWPRFDLALLGLGPDGHTASLFPGSPALGASEVIATCAHAGHAPWVDRVTLTLPVLNRAQNVLFLAQGADKAHVLKQVLEGEASDKPLPAAAVRPVDGVVTWLVDQAIASQLSPVTASAPGSSA